jgi:hypothetical protein
MIKCIAPKTINTNELAYKLEIYIKKYFPQAIINLKTNESYWKYPECNKIIYQLFNSQSITVTEFIEHLFLSWHHKKIDSEEEAIWNKNCYPEEVFLMPEIEWIHIYTWEDEELIIN